MEAGRVGRYPETMGRSGVTVALLLSALCGCASNSATGTAATSDGGDAASNTDAGGSATTADACNRYCSALSCLYDDSAYDTAYPTLTLMERCILDCDSTTAITKDRDTPVADSCERAYTDYINCRAGLSCDVALAAQSQPRCQRPCGTEFDIYQQVCRCQPQECNVAAECAKATSGTGSSGAKCDSNSDCASQKACRSGKCVSVDCTTDSHCGSCQRCSSNSCVNCGSGEFGCYC
ncbi:MAG TPA: hypothetical protein PKA88_08865 [Polyangiaceae bacterium]|nr:hypothetical protein [Polyangiaceae bacterium]